MSRAQLTSTVEQNSAGAAAPLVAGKNLLINGGFDIWARGASTTNLNAYTADRWYTQTAGGATTSQQSAGAPNGSQYFLRCTSNASAGGANYYQFIETANVAQMWGKTVTFTVLLRRNSSMNASMTVQLFKSSSVDAGIAQHPGTLLGSVTVSNASMPTGTGSSNWYTATITAAIPNDGTANSVYVQIALNANIATGASFDIAQAQLEIGSVATPFSRAGTTLQGELSLCQRYYEQVNFRIRGTDSGVIDAIMIYFRTEKRISPSTTVTTGSGGTSFSVGNSSTSGIAITITGNPYDTGNANIKSDAEL